MMHEDVWQNGPNTQPLQWPTVGNLLVASVIAGSNGFHLNSITNAGNTWNPTGDKVGTLNGGMSQIFYACNANPSTDMTLILNWNSTTSGGHGTVWFYDVTGAATATSCFDNDVATENIAGAEPVSLPPSHQRPRTASSSPTWAWRSTRSAA